MEHANATKAVLNHVAFLPNTRVSQGSPGSYKIHLLQPNIRFHGDPTCHIQPRYARL